MQEKEHNKSKNRFKLACEIVSLGLLAIAVYVGGILFLGKPINRYMPVWFSGPAGPLMILGADVAWVLGMKYWHTKNVVIRIVKKIASVFVLFLSASVLTSWFILNAFRAMW